MRRRTHGRPGDHRDQCPATLLVGPQLMLFGVVVFVVRRPNRGDRSLRDRGRGKRGRDTSLANRTRGGGGISAALVATLTLTLGVLRNQRRKSASMADQITAVNKVLFERSRDDEYITGVFVEVPSDGAPPTVVSAGHPEPWRVRDGRAERLVVQQALPMGMFRDSPYVPRVLDLRPGDRLVLVSDGVVDTLESSASTMSQLLLEGEHLHPREVVQLLTSTVVSLQRRTPRDDATAVCIDWHGGAGGRDSSDGSDVDGASAALE